LPAKCGSLHSLARKKLPRQKMGLIWTAGEINTIDGGPRRPGRPGGRHPWGWRPKVREMRPGLMALRSLHLSENVGGVPAVGSPASQSTGLRARSRCLARSIRLRCGSMTLRQPVRSWIAGTACPPCPRRASRWPLKPWRGFYPMAQATVTTEIRRGQGDAGLAQAGIG
jgi:hypothetical protein